MSFSNFAFSLAFVVLFHVASAQEMAFSERGDTVILYADGTWDYFENFAKGDSLSSNGPKLNSDEFVKPKTSTNKVSGFDERYAVWYDPKIWKRVPPGSINPDADMAFQLLNGDAYGMVIFEELQIPMQNLSEIALTNAINVAPDMSVKGKDLRVVNDQQLIWMQMAGTTQGIPIVYCSYYFSWEGGSIQFHTFTGQNVFDKYKPQLFNLLNGLVIGD